MATAPIPFVEEGWDGGPIPAHAVQDFPSPPPEAPSSAGAIAISPISIQKMSPAYVMGRKQLNFSFLLKFY